MADKKQKIYRKKTVATPPMFGFAVAHSGHEPPAAESSASPVRPSDTVKAGPELQREADRLLLSRYSPPAVVVSDQMEIIQTRGRTGSFLELSQGKASLNLLKMARPGLLFELQAALDEAKRTGVEAERHNLRVEDDGQTRVTSLRVLPFHPPVQDQRSYLVIFEPGSAQTEVPVPKDTQPFTESERAERDKQITQLKQELSATREYLQSIIEMQEATNEELQSANEEIQSGNEELQSTNEELQTSKEELESANEELHTVNEEMQHRNELLTQANNDLTNLINSINLPMVMVSSDLSVRRFTPAAITALGLAPSDVGRPIPRLRLKVDSRHLEQMMLDVMQDVQPKHFHVQDDEGRSFTLRINPYRTMDNRIDGAVLTMVDSSSGDGPDGNRPAKHNQSDGQMTKTDAASSDKR